MLRASQFNQCCAVPAIIYINGAEKHPRTACENGNHLHACYVRVSSHSKVKVDAAEQKDMVNLGVRGTTDRSLMTEVVFKVLLRVSYLLPALSNPSA